MVVVVEVRLDLATALALATAVVSINHRPAMVEVVMCSNKPTIKEAITVAMGMPTFNSQPMEAASVVPMDPTTFNNLHSDRKEAMADINNHRTPSSTVDRTHEASREEPGIVRLMVRSALVIGVVRDRLVLASPMLLALLLQTLLRIFADATRPIIVVARRVCRIDSSSCLY